MRDLITCTNIISVNSKGLSPDNPRYPLVKARFESRTACKVFIPIVSVMEIECGLVMGAKGDPAPELAREISDLRGFLGRFPKIKIDGETVAPYVTIRAKVFELHCERNHGRNSYKKKKTHQLTERNSDISLGIDERDLMIVCLAIQKNLTLVTLDSAKEMKIIVEAVRTLEREGNSIIEGRADSFDVEYWDLPLGTYSSDPTSI